MFGVIQHKNSPFYRQASNLLCPLNASQEKSKVLKKTPKMKDVWLPKLAPVPEPRFWKCQEMEPRFEKGQSRSHKMPTTQHWSGVLSNKPFNILQIVLIKQTALSTCCKVAEKDANNLMGKLEINPIVSAKITFILEGNVDKWVVESKVAKRRFSPKSVEESVNRLINVVLPEFV